MKNNKLSHGVKQVLCQSCGMKMEKQGDFGTSKDGKQNMEYCRNCFQGGFFTNPHATMQEQIDKMTSREMSRHNISEYDAKKKFTSLIPTLDRWKNNRQPNKAALDNQQRKNIQVFLGFGIAVLILAITLYIFTPEGTPDPKSGNDDSDSSSMFPIWIAVLIPFIVAQKKKQWKNKQKKAMTTDQQRKFFIILTLVIILLIGSVIFFSTQK